MANKTMLAFVLALLVMRLPVLAAEAQRAEAAAVKPGPGQAAAVLPGWLTLILAAAGIKVIVVGGVVIVGGWLVYRAASAAWTWYAAYSYNTFPDHAYKHINEFPRIWPKPPSKQKFKEKCLQNMNSKNVERYIQIADQRSVAFSPGLEMVTIGETDGKTIVNCMPHSKADVAKKVAKGLWKKI